MADVFEYLDWRGDIPFETDPFNEVDNVILSILSYVDLEGVFDPEAGEKILLEEAAGRYFSIHNREEVLARKTVTRMTPFLLEKAAKTRRFGKTIAHDYVNRIDAAAAEQMSAITFDLEDGTVYVAFRGTDSTIAGWKEDFDLAYLPCTSGQEHAAEYLTGISKKTDCPLRVGGHSKGGNLAVFASAFCAQAVRERIIQVFCNDGPGFIKEVVSTAEFQAVIPKVLKLVPEGSLLGLLMHGDFPREVIRSSAKGIMQHDMLTWQMLGTRFVRADGLSNTSQMMEKTLKGWIDDLTPEERKEFVNVIFDAVSQSGANTIAQLNEKPLQNYTEIAKAIFGMDKEKKDTFRKVLSGLGKNGREVFSAKWKELLNGVKTQADEKVKAVLEPQPPKAERRPEPEK